MAGTEIIPKKVAIIKGCSIKEDTGRLDFYVQEKITAEEIQKIEHRANEIIAEAMPVYSYHHHNEPEAWYWKCGEFVCPCGGTHVKNTSDVGKISVKRKSVGKTIDRMIVQLNNIRLKAEAYH